MNKKVIYVTSQTPYENGEIWAINELNSLIDANIDLYIVPRTGAGKIIHKDAKKLEPKTIKTPFINVQIFIILVKKILNEPTDTYRILKWIINHSDTFIDLIKGFIVFPKSIYISNLLKDKNIVHIHAFSTTSVAVVAYILSHELNLPWSITFHSSWHLNEAHRKSTSKQLNSVAFVRTVSNEVKQSLINFMGATFASKIKTIHIGVNYEMPSQTKDETSDYFSIASVGGLLPHKGIDISLKAASKLKNSGISNFKWFFYGDGPLWESLIKITKDLQLENNVFFCGNLDNSELKLLYKKKTIDLYVQNSINRNKIHEGIPVSIMEAMAFSVPVIASDCGGTKELVNGDSGILIKQGDSEETYQAILTLLKNQEKRILLGKKGNEKIYEDFNSTKIAIKLYNCFCT